MSLVDAYDLFTTLELSISVDKYQIQTVNSMYFTMPCPNSVTFKCTAEMLGVLHKAGAVIKQCVSNFINLAVVLSSFY